jgi:hypothetical protein
MWWQDGLALLMVAGAVFGLLRAYAPVGWFRFGACRDSDRSAKSAESTSACSGCALGSSCAKAPIQARPGVTQPSE